MRTCYIAQGTPYSATAYTEEESKRRVSVYVCVCVCS